MPPLPRSYVATPRRPLPVIDFNHPPDMRKEFVAIFVLVCLGVALLIAAGAAVLMFVPGPLLELLP